MEASWIASGERLAVNSKGKRVEFNIVQYCVDTTNNRVVFSLMRNDRPFKLSYIKDMKLYDAAARLLRYKALSYCVMGVSPEQVNKIQAEAKDLLIQGKIYVAVCWEVSVCK